MYNYIDTCITAATCNRMRGVELIEDTAQRVDTFVYRSIIREGGHSY